MNDRQALIAFSIDDSASFVMGASKAEPIGDQPISSISCERWTRFRLTFILSSDLDIKPLLDLKEEDIVAYQKALSMFEITDADVADSKRPLTRII